jgi:hypothetical protein
VKRRESDRVPLVLVALALAVALQTSPTTRLDEGIALYGQLEFERATIVFQRLALEPDLTPQTRASVFLWLGLAYGQLGDLDSARQAFARAMLNDATMAAPPDTPPELAAMIEEERAKKSTSRPAVAPASPASPAPPDFMPHDEPAPAAAPAAAPVPAATPSMSGMTWAAVGAGIGAVTLAGGATVLGLAGARQYEVANDLSLDASTALAAYDESVLLGTGAVVLGSAAVVATGAAVAFFVLE